LALAVIWLGSLNPACDRRFEFDVESGGAAGTAPTMNGGSAPGGSTSAGSGGGAGDGGVGGAGNQAGVAGAGAAGGGAAGGTASTACGELAECTLGTHCADGHCAQCAGDADCQPYALPRCEPTRHRCVACVTSADCQPGFACDSLANRCLQTCLEDENCPVDAHGCDEGRLVCYQCDEDRECATSPLGHLCASDGSGCVQCRKEADCPGHHCDQLRGRCVECRDGRDCTSQVCDPTSFTCAK
jgi:hypothetical protein